jgi:hypothetical protein
VQKNVGNLTLKADFLKILMVWHKRCVCIYDYYFESAECVWGFIHFWQANILNPEKFPFVVLGNKIDVENGASRAVD